MYRVFLYMLTNIIIETYSNINLPRNPTESKVIMLIMHQPN